MSGAPEGPSPQSSAINQFSEEILEWVMGRPHSPDVAAQALTMAAARVTGMYASRDPGDCEDLTLALMAVMQAATLSLRRAMTVQGVLPPQAGPLQVISAEPDADRVSSLATVASEALMDAVGDTRADLEASLLAAADLTAELADALGTVASLPANAITLELVQRLMAGAYARTQGTQRHAVPPPNTIVNVQVHVQGETMQ